jgi:ABC-type transporter Mla subunit MlaD
MNAIAMTTEQRIDRLEALAESILLAIQRNSQQIERNSQQIERNSQQIERNSQQIERNSQLIERNSQLIERNSQQIERNSQQIQDSISDAVAMISSLAETIAENSTYIRGLQAENRRILDILLSDRREE